MITNRYREERAYCPICFSNDLEILHKHSFNPISEVSLFHTYDVTLCNKCGMVFANNIPSQEEFDRYYALFSKYEAGQYSSRLTGLHNDVVDVICEHYSSESRIIDIGCGGGGVLRELYKRGYRNLTGIDSSETNITELNEFGEINGICNTIFSFDFCAYANKYDVVVITGVLEHIVDLTGAMEIISGLLDDNGVVVLSVPDLNKFLDETNYPFKEFSVEHINFFNEQSLVTLFSQYGMSLEGKQSYLMHVIAIFKKNRNTKEMIDEYIRLCNEQTNRILSKISDKIASNEPVVLWGTGTFTQYLLANTEAKNLNIISFVDSNNNYHGRKLMGKPIIPSSNLLDEMYANITIVISAYHSLGNEITDIIRNKLCLPNEIIQL